MKLNDLSYLIKKTCQFLWPKSRSIHNNPVEVAVIEGRAYFECVLIGFSAKTAKSSRTRLEDKGKYFLPSRKTIVWETQIK